MNEKTSVKGSLGMALVAGIAGLLCFTALPIMVSKVMTAVLQGAEVKIAATGNPLLATAPRIVLAFFPVWGGLSVAAGIALLLAAWGLYKGEAWARPTAIGLLAIPSVTGAYFSGPVMMFGKPVIPLFILIALLGLVPYFILLLWGKDYPGGKVAKFFVFLLLGVTAAWSFSNGGSSLRQFWARPEFSPLDASNTGFILGVPVIWTGVLAAIFSIPFLAAATARRLAVGCRWRGNHPDGQPDTLCDPHRDQGIHDRDCHGCGQPDTLIHSRYRKKTDKRVIIPPGKQKSAHPSGFLLHYAGAMMSGENSLPPGADIRPIPFFHDRHEPGNPLGEQESGTAPVEPAGEECFGLRVDECPDWNPGRRAWQPCFPDHPPGFECGHRTKPAVCFQE